MRGIGHYGNSIGVPTIGGEVYFEGPYEQNCLVNAMALGLAETRQHDPLARRSASATSIVLYGASTGRDGIGGASVLASAELGEADEDKRPTVQVGDPFEESKLVECSLELLERGLLVALQDLGAAGLTSSAAEMASKGGVGIDLDVDRVPLREADMEPFEIMVSRVAGADALRRRARAASTRCSRCARHVGGPRHRDRRGHRHRRTCGSSDGDELVGDMPVAALVDDCPLYDLAPQRPAAPLYPRRRRRWPRARRCTTRCSR